MKREGTVTVSGDDDDYIPPAPRFATRITRREFERQKREHTQREVAKLEQYVKLNPHIAARSLVSIITIMFYIINVVSFIYPCGLGRLY